MENFKDIVWFEGLYQISNLGNVKSLKTNKILKKRFMEKRWMYEIIDLRIWSNFKKTLRISRLVAQAFLWLDISDSKMLACHKDDNPCNNRLDNLFLCTHIEHSALHKEGHKSSPAHKAKMRETVKNTKPHTKRRNHAQNKPIENRLKRHNS